MSDTLNQLLELLESVLMIAYESAVNTPLPAAMLAVVVLAIQLTCSRWLRPAQMGLLWGIVLVRLMMPVAPPSAFSLQHLLPAGDPWAAAEGAPAADWSPATAGDPLPPRADQAHPTLVAETFVDQVMVCLPLVWLLGCVVVLFGTAARYMLFAVRLRRSAPNADPRVVGLVDECRRSLSVRRMVRVIVTDAVRQPAVMGVWRPTLLIPSHVINLSDAELRMVLLHELAHVRCQDVAMNWLLLVVRAVHWANPVCWLAASRFLNLREQSRDAMVLRASEGDARHVYSTMLVTLAGHSGPPRRWRVIIPGLLPGLVCGLFEKQTVASRLKAIHRSASAQPKWQAAIALLLLAGALVTGCTDPSGAAFANKFPEPDSITQLAIKRGFRRGFTDDSSSLNNGHSTPLDIRSYDITAAARRMTEIHGVDVDAAVEAARLQATTIIIHTFPPNHSSGEAADQETPAATLRQDGEDWFLDVIADQAAHRHMTQQIAAWEQSGMAQIVVEIRMVDSPIDLSFRGHVDWQSISASTAPLPPPTESLSPANCVTGSSAIDLRLPVMTTVVPNTTLRRIVELFQSHSRSNISFAPKVTMFNGQSATITSGVQRPFVTGVSLVNGRREPQIEVCPDGFEMQLRPVLSGDRSTTQLSGRALLSKIVDVKTSSTQLTDGPVTIQLPHVQRHTIDFRSEIRDGESLIVACPPPSDGNSYFYLLLTPHPDSDAEIGPLGGMLPSP